jgi:carboxyl-terminal processing protease
MTLPPQGTGSPDESVPGTSPGLVSETPLGASEPGFRPWLTAGWPGPDQPGQPAQPGWQAPPGWQNPQAPPAWQNPPGWQAPFGWQGPTPRRDRQPSGRAIFAFVLVIAIAFGAGGAVGLSQGSGSGLGGSTGLLQPSSSFPPQFAVYEQAWQILHDKYVDPKALDPTTLTYGSISGLLSAVGDTDHTRFLTPQDLANENSSLSGSVVGIGAEMSTVNGAPVIQSVIPGSPAEKAGLLGGDTVLSVDGTSTDGQSVDTVVSRIRGDAGTTVTLSILHTAAAAPIEVKIVRAKVDVPSVSWAMVPGTKVADVRIEEFATNATSQLVTIIAAARKGGATALILDLRGNPGGYVDEAVGVASQFLKDGDVYREQDRTGSIKEIPIKPGGTDTDLPLAVLVDTGTASSAEIVSGALQDAKRGTLIGAKTFGTGTVLQQFPLSDGSALLIGTIEWLTRDGRQIWKQGIQPDIPLDSTPKGKIVAPVDLAKMTAAQLAASGDAQLLKGVAVLTKP